MNSSAVSLLDEQSLQADPLSIDWLLQNQQQLPSLNQLPGAGKFPFSLLPTSVFTGSGFTSVCLNSPPLTAAPPSRIVEETDENNTYVLRNQQISPEHYKPGVNKNLTILNLNDNLLETKQSEPLDLSCSNGVQKPKKANDDYFPSFFPIQQKQTHTLTNQNPQLFPPASVNSSHFEGGGYSYSAVLPIADHQVSPVSSWSLTSPYPPPPQSSTFLFCSTNDIEENNKNERYSTPPPRQDDTPLQPPLSTAHPIVWVPFATIGRTETIPAPIDAFSNNNTGRRTSRGEAPTTQTATKMVPVNPPPCFLFFQGRNDQPSPTGGKWPSKKQVPSALSSNLCSSPSSSSTTPSPAVSASRRKHSTTSSSSSFPAFSLPSSSSILVRRKLYALLKNRN